MRVLIAHNRYRSANPSGENRVVQAEIELLRSAGVDVIPMIEDSDSLLDAPLRRKAVAALGPVYSTIGVERFKRSLESARPDVVHLHNVFPLISPAVIRVASSRGIPTVQTVHNYRHSCINGLHLRKEQVCTKCLNKRIPLAGIQHGCYRDSRIQSVPMAMSQAIHHATWQQVNQFIALTPFMAVMLETQGISRSKIALRQSWVPDHGEASPPGEDMLFVGRLDASKGIGLLLQAWEASSPASTHRKLRIIGDGPLASLVQETASRTPSIDYLGALDPGGVLSVMRESGAIIVPSLWFEGYPLVIAEAMSLGRPVIAVDGGSIETILDEKVGWTCEPTVSDLARTIGLATMPEIIHRGRQARQRYEAHNSPAASLESLLTIYRQLTGNAT